MTCWLITQSWSFHCCVMGVFSIYLLMSQIDFLLIRTVADAIVNSYTTYSFLRNKKTNPEKYAQWYHKDKAESNPDDGSTL
eukprot:1925637-Rhodomonas_salina.1